MNPIKKQNKKNRFYSYLIERISLVCAILDIKQQIYSQIKFNFPNKFLDYKISLFLFSQNTNRRLSYPHFTEAKAFIEMKCFVVKISPLPKPDIYRRRVHPVHSAV